MKLIYTETWSLLEKLGVYSETWSLLGKFGVNSETSSLSGNLGFTDKTWSLLGNLDLILQTLKKTFSESDLSFIIRTRIYLFLRIMGF